MMFTTWTNHQDLDPRLDAGRYAPSFLAALKLVKSLSPHVAFGTLRDASTPISYGILQPREFLQGSGVFMVRAVDLGNPFLVREKVVRVPSEVEEPYRRSRLAPGDLLISIAGTLGAIGLAPRFPTIANVNQSVARFRAGENADSYYLAAYFLSSLGQKLLAREAVGSVQHHLNLEDLPGVLIACPEPRIQKAIGNKVRKAERLRELAHVALTEVDGRMSAMVPRYPSTPESFSWTDTAFLTDRLDPQPYRSHTLELLKAIRQIRHTALDDVCSVTGGCAVPSEEFSEGGTRLVRIRDIGASDFERPDVFVSTSFCDRNRRYMAKESMIVVGMDGSFRAQLFLTADLPAMINQRVAMLTAHAMRPELVLAWLNRPEGQIQMLRRSVKTTVEHISLEDIRAVMLPRLDEEAEGRLADKIGMARLYTSEAAHLIKAAKSDVESLISGVLDLDALQAESTAIEFWLAANSSPVTSAD
jgi:type I restriction enzyme S subunit